MPALQTFRAVVRKQGPNPYVDVPPRVCRALARWAVAGRIAWDGALNGAPVRGTILPCGRGRHRIWVNAGMRAAADVGPGDRVAFSIRGAAPGVVRPPRDVSAALRATAGAKAAFDALPPSHRRQLLRWVEEARAPSTRARRVVSTVDHVLGRLRRAAPRGAGPALWTCPRCGARFVARNHTHSCRRVDPSAPFRGKPAFVRDLFDRVRALLRRFGPFEEVAYRDKIGFMVRVRFAGATPRRAWLDVGFWLRRRVESPRMRRVETIYPDAHVHVVRLTRPSDVDAELGAWLREAYDVGCQRATPTA